MGKLLEQRNRALDDINAGRTVKKIRDLESRVRELEEENARLNGVIESNIDDGIDKIMAMSDEQISALAGFEGSNPQDKATIARQCMDIAMLRFDLAASQAYAEQLREALKASDDLLRDLPASGGFYGLAVMENNEQALATPISTEALDAYVAEKVKEAKP